MFLIIGLPSSALMAKVSPEGQCCSTRDESEEFEASALLAGVHAAKPSAARRVNEFWSMLFIGGVETVE
jgi:hypothetical protein